MREELVKQTLSSYLQENQKEFLQEFHFEDCIIDFVVKNTNGIWYGIEVKGLKSQEMLTLGQLIHYYQHCSHVVLCAPKEFLDKFISKLNLNPESQPIINKLGIFLINEKKQIEIIREPDNQSYYFKLPPKSLWKKISKTPKYGILDPLDEFILEMVREKGAILMGEIYETITKEKANFGMEALRKRLKNLVYFNYLKYTSKYPLGVSLR